MIGCELVWGTSAGVVVETEAYGAVGDEAAHTFIRTLARSFVQEKPAGALYVYLNYGVHWLLNFLVKGPRENGFVLVRALQPLYDLKTMRARRGVDEEARLCSGPGKLTQALGIDGGFHGADFFSLSHAALYRPLAAVALEADRRVGITKAADLEWRFFLAGSRYVSKGKQKTRPTSTS
jgi:DNA-3-methyladenine glycosylase